MSATPPPVMLAHKWDLVTDVTGWWMSEKLDGVRAYWDGTQFLSRLGNPFNAPSWFTEGLPRTPLDGELWGGRKQFQVTVGTVKRHDNSTGWDMLTYMVFDAPNDTRQFESRMQLLDPLLKSAKNAEAVFHERCMGYKHLRSALAHVELTGGEGLMLRKPGSLYEVGRSHTLLKVKSFHDAEAMVVDYAPGKGKHKGRVGALVVQLPDGTRFNVGTGFTDAERENPPAIGSVITYRFQELSNGGVPRFSSYVGERIDAEAK